MRWNVIKEGYVGHKTIFACVFVYICIYVCMYVYIYIYINLCRWDRNGLISKKNVEFPQLFPQHGWGCPRKMFEIFAFMN